MGATLPVEVVIPLRWSSGSSSGPEGRDRLDELAAYLEELSALADVTVVDGSDPEEAEEHAASFTGAARVLPPKGRGLNGKVVGALTGIAASRHELVILADDDVRYGPDSLGQVVEALQDCDVVRPQNVFTSWPWHARWDTGRSLLARAVGADWPGTFGLRASAIAAMGGWDPDVLFENLEMVRTAQASGLRVCVRPDILVGRIPPPARHFLNQRLRQAYDDWAQPGRLATELSIVPVTALLAYRWPRGLVVLAVAVLGAASVGEWRYRRLPVPWDAPLWSLPWLLERGLLVWGAVVVRARGGVRYHGRRVSKAASRRRDLVQRGMAVPASVPAGAAAPRSAT
jgi:hypothetical protein